MLVMNASIQRRAILCVLAASFGYSCSAAVVRGLSVSYPALEMMLFRSLVVVVVTLPLLLRQGGLAALRPRAPMGHLARLASGYLGMITAFYGYGHLPLATNTALGFCMPLFLTLLSVPLLGEVVGWRRRAAVLVGLAGVLVMIRPWEAQAALPLWPVAVVLVGVVGWALAMISIRRMGAAGESNIAIVAWFGIGSLLLSAVLVIPYWVMPDWGGLLGMLAIGLITSAAQVLMTEGYRMGETTLVAPFEYGAIVYSTLLGAVLWGEVPDPIGFVGIGVIVAAGLYIWWRESGRLRQA